MRICFWTIGHRLQMVGMSDALKFALPMQQADLVSAYERTNVHANRVLRELRQRGVVAFTGGNVDVHDVGALHAIAEFDERYLYLSPR